MGRTKRIFLRLTAPFRPLPDFLIIGAQKAGTSTLFAQLAAHPEVRPPWTKELIFFCRRFERTTTWYRQNFPIGWPVRKWKTLEASPDYLFHPPAAERIRQTLPGAPLIVMLRDPVSRAYSHYQMTRRRGFETLPFAEAVAAEEERLRPEWEQRARNPDYLSWPLLRFSYLARGRYAEQLEHWLRVFPREQILIFTQDQLARDPQPILREICEKVGLRVCDLPPVPNENVGSYEPMDPRVGEELREYFAPHNRRLYELLGRDFGW